MRLPLILTASIAGLVISACARGPREPDPLDSVRLTFDLRDVKGCDLINTFEGNTFGGKNIEGSRKELKRIAQRHGADTVLVLDESDGGRRCCRSPRNVHPEGRLALATATSAAPATPAAAARTTTSPWRLGPPGRP